MKTVFNISLIILLAITIYSCGQQSEAAKGQPLETIPVKTINLSADNSSPTIAVAGRFTTDDEVYLSFKTGGIIKNLKVNEGDRIKKGQLLAALNMTEIDAQVQQIQLSLEKAQRDFKRVNALFKDSVATLEQVQNTETALQLAEQQMEAIQFNKKYATIYATEDGYVLAKMVNEGQLVGPGTPVLKTNGAEAGNWILRVGVSDKEWMLIQPEDSANIEISSVSGQTISGKVIRKSQGTDPKSGSFMVDIKINENSPHLAAGMFGQASIYTRPQENSNASPTWSIPYDALLDGDGSTGYVFVTTDGKIAKKQQVTIAGIENNQVIITGSLQENQKLIIAGSAYLTDNSPIHIIQ